MKQARVAFPHLIAAILILVLIIVVVFVFSPMLEELKGKLGFGIDLTAGEIKAQGEAKEFFSSTLSLIVKDCMNYNQSKCFCSNQEVAFPSEYVLNFNENEEGFVLSLDNHVGGRVIEEKFKNIMPIIVSSDNQPRRFQESGFKITYSSDSLVMFGEASESIDLNYTFFKWDDGILAILSDTYSEQRRVVQNNLCSN